MHSGAVHVSNGERGGWDTTTAWRLVEDLRIGSADNTGAGAFSGIRVLEVDWPAAFYMIENQPHEVPVFSDEGAFLRVLGRTGADPGEYDQAGGLAWAPLAAS